ncbi:MAG: hypothetical protein E7K04_05755, partial [Helicobacter sp.]|nr:hypothetical protein [Helicobacter sp.]
RKLWADTKGNNGSINVEFGSDSIDPVIHGNVINASKGTIQYGKDWGEINVTFKQSSGSKVEGAIINGANNADSSKGTINITFEQEGSILAGMYNFNAGKSEVRFQGDSNKSKVYGNIVTTKNGENRLVFEKGGEIYARFYNLTPNNTGTTGTGAGASSSGSNGQNGSSLSHVPQNIITTDPNVNTKDLTKDLPSYLGAKKYDAIVITKKDGSNTNRPVLTFKNKDSNTEKTLDLKTKITNDQSVEDSDKKNAKTKYESEKNKINNNGVQRYLIRLLISSNPTTNPTTTTASATTNTTGRDKYIPSPPPVPSTTQSSANMSYHKMLNDRIVIENDNALYYFYPILDDKKIENNLPSYQNFTKLIYKGGDATNDNYVLATIKESSTSKIITPSITLGYDAAKLNVVKLRTDKFGKISNTSNPSASNNTTNTTNNNNATNNNNNSNNETYITHFANGVSFYYEGTTRNATQSAHLNTLDLIYATKSSINDYLDSLSYQTTQDQIPTTSTNSENPENTTQTPESNNANQSDLATTDSSDSAQASQDSQNQDSSDSAQAPKKYLENPSRLWASISSGRLSNNLLYKTDSIDLEKKELNKITNYQILSIGYDYALAHNTQNKFGANSHIGLYTGLINGNTTDNVSKNINPVTGEGEGVKYANQKAIELGSYYALVTNGYDFTETAQNTQIPQNPATSTNLDNPENPNNQNDENANQSDLTPAQAPTLLDYALKGLFINTSAKLSFIQSDINILHNLTQSQNNIALTLSQDIGYKLKLTKDFTIKPKLNLTYAQISKGNLTQQREQYFLKSKDNISPKIFETSLGALANYHINLDDNNIDLYAQASMNYASFTQSLNLSSNQNAKNINLNANSINLAYKIGSILQLIQNLKLKLELQGTTLGNINKTYQANTHLQWSF